MSAQICPKVIKMATILDFWSPFWNSNSNLGNFFKLENVASSHNLVLECIIPSNSIKQGMFILPAKFNHISTYMHVNEWDFPKFCPIYHYPWLKWSEIQHRRSKNIKFGIELKGMLPISSYFNNKTLGNLVNTRGAKINPVYSRGVPAGTFSSFNA